MNNRIKLGVYGNNIRRFINLCTQNGIALYDISIASEQSYECFISLSNIADIRKYARKSQVHIRILQKPFWYVFFSRYKRRVILFLCLATCCGTIFFVSGRLCIIRINSTNENIKEQIEKELVANKVKTGVEVKSIDCDAIEEKLKERFPEISWVSVSRKGVILEIDFEKAVYNTRKKQSKTINSPIIAQKDATIKSIITRKGTPCVVAGDAVKKGDMLVDNKVAITDDNELIVNYLIVDADASIVAATEYSFELEICENKSKEKMLRNGYYDLNILMNKLSKKGVTIVSINDKVNNYQMITDNSTNSKKTNSKKTNNRKIIYKGKIKAYESIGVKK